MLDLKSRACVIPADTGPAQLESPFRCFRGGMLRMSKSFLTLQPSEGIVVQAAAQIYAAYIQSGQVVSGQEAEWMKKSIKESMQLAKAIDELVVSDDEMA